MQLELVNQTKGVERLRLESQNYITSDWNSKLNLISFQRILWNISSCRAGVCFKSIVIDKCGKLLANQSKGIQVKRHITKIRLDNRNITSDYI